MSLKSFTFYCRNDRTREIATFIGQGESIDEAAKDAVKTLNEPFRPSSSGGANEYTTARHKLNVRRPDGSIVNMEKKEFERDADPAPKIEGEPKQ